MENLKSIYFTSKKNFIKCFLLQEHEYSIYRFVKALRKEEFAKNGLLKKIYRRRKNIIGRKLGFTIPANVFDEGLHIWHYGNIVVNGNAKVGKNCILHGDNCIGNDGKSEGAPKIGNNVDIGVGAKIIGNVEIADDVTIGAGAVVVSSFKTKGVTIVGIPAREVKKE